MMVLSALFSICSHRLAPVSVKGTCLSARRKEDVLCENQLSGNGCVFDMPYIPMCSFCQNVEAEVVCCQIKGSTCSVTGF